MLKLNTNQKGFAAVEAILIVVIIALIGGVGYFVYHANQKTSDTLNSAAKVAQSSPPKTNEKQNSTAKSTVQNFVTIKEWDVRAPYNGDLSLEYIVKSSNGDEYASFTSTKLDSANTSCKSDPTYGGIISRYKSTDTVKYEGGEDSGKTPAQYLVDSNIPKDTYTQVGDYYYIYSHPNGVCGTYQATQDAMTETDAAVKQLTVQLTAVLTKQ